MFKEFSLDYARPKELALKHEPVREELALWT
jgi:hypothetical protein